MRFHNYTQYPPRGASSDEYTYTFLGQSLLQKGVPTSWSFMPFYPQYGHREDLTVDKIYFPIVSPYFDHPPLNGILVGAWAILNGEKSFQSARISTIRQIPIFLGIITSILTLLLAIKLYDRKTGIWALLIYSVSTIIIINTRAVFAENLLTPLYLLSLLIFLIIKKKPKITHMIILSILSGLAFWTKELGITVFISILLLSLMERFSLKLLATFSLLSLFFFGLYPLYGYFYNWKLYTAVVFSQSMRVIGPNTLNSLFFKPIVVDKVYFDGWYLFGFVSFFASFLDLKSNKYVLIPSFTYFFLMLISLSKEGDMGWYMIPLFPFFSILSAHLLREGIKKKNGYIFIAVLFVGLYIVRYYFEAKFGLPNLTYRILMGIAFFPLLVSFMAKWERMFELLSEVWFYSMIVVTIYISYYYIHPV